MDKFICRTYAESFVFAVEGMGWRSGKQNIIEWGGNHCVDPRPSKEPHVSTSLFQSFLFLKCQHYTNRSVTKNTSRIREWTTRPFKGHTSMALQKPTSAELSHTVRGNLIAQLRCFRHGDSCDVKAQLWSGGDGSDMIWRPSSKLRKTWLSPVFEVWHWKKCMSICPPRHEHMCTWFVTWWIDG